MRISDLITPASIAVRVHIDDKPDALRFAAMALGSRSGLDPERIWEALAAREALGSTGIGHGVAVPHVCLPDLDRPYAFLCSLAKPIGFDAIDGERVDLVCAVIAPANSKSGGSESLTNLAAISRLLRDKDRATALRKAIRPAEIYDVVVRQAEKASQPAS
jgi:PTS system nitrogen regulatory IIA component